MQTFFLKKHSLSIFVKTLAQTPNIESFCTWREKPKGRLPPAPKNSVYVCTIIITSLHPTPLSLSLSLSLSRSPFLCRRLVEILTGDWELSRQLRVPATTRMQVTTLSCHYWCTKLHIGNIPLMCEHAREKRLQLACIVYTFLSVYIAACSNF